MHAFKKAGTFSFFFFPPFVIARTKEFHHDGRRYIRKVLKTRINQCDLCKNRVFLLFSPPFSTDEPFTMNAVISTLLEKRIYSFWILKTKNRSSGLVLLAFCNLRFQSAPHAQIQSKKRNQMDWKAENKSENEHTRQTWK